jgi:hypothetical protein
MPEIDEMVRDVDQGRQQVASDEAEALRGDRLVHIETMQEINTSEETAELMANSTGAMYRARKLQERYGEGIGGRWRAFMAGEFDFDVDESGQIQRTGYNRLIEFGRRTVRTLTNRQTLVTAASCAVVGALTGGVGIPAAMALTGAIAGRGIGEAWEAFCGKRVNVAGNQYSLRELVARREFQEHSKLKEMAAAALAPELTDEERNSRLQSLVNAFTHIDEETTARQREQLEEDATWNKRRDVCAKIGAVAGLGAGLWAGAAGLGNQIMTMDIDGNGISHLVANSHHGWQFAYNHGLAEAVQNHDHVFRTLVDHPGLYFHDLGESTGKVVWGAAKNILPHLAQLGAVAAGLFAGRALEKRAEACALENFDQTVASNQREATSRGNYLEQQIPGHLERRNREPETGQARWEAAFGQGRVPRGNQIWVINQFGQMPVIYRIETVNLDGGFVQATQLDQNLNPLVAAANGAVIRNPHLQLDVLKQFGKQNTEKVTTWRQQFARGGEIHLTEDHQPIFDINNHQIPVDNYHVFFDANDNQNVTLRREGQEDLKVSMFQFALYNINRFHPEGEDQPEAAPVENAITNHVWEITHPDALPDDLARALTGEHFVIGEVTPANIQVFIYDMAQRATDRANAITMSRAEWQQIQESIHETRIVVQAQQGGGGNRGGGRGGNQGGGNGRRGGGGNNREPNHGNEDDDDGGDDE